MSYQAFGLHSAGSQTLIFLADQQTIQFQAPSSVPWPCNYPYFLLIKRHSRKQHKQNSSLSSLALKYDMFIICLCNATSMLIAQFLLSQHPPFICTYFANLQLLRLKFLALDMYLKIESFKKRDLTVSTLKLIKLFSNNFT